MANTYREMALLLILAALLLQGNTRATIVGCWTLQTRYIDGVYGWRGDGTFISTNSGTTGRFRLWSTAQGVYLLRKGKLRMRYTSIRCMAAPSKYQAYANVQMRLAMRDPDVYRIRWLDRDHFTMVPWVPHRPFSALLSRIPLDMGAKLIGDCLSRIPGATKPSGSAPVPSKERPGNRNHYL